MIVPSRSKNTAGVFPSAILEILEQLFATDGCSPKLSYNHGTSVIGDIGSFQRSRAGRECERKERDCGIACAGNVENLARFRGHVMRHLAALEKHHPLFAERDEQ